MTQGRKQSSKDNSVHYCFALFFLLYQPDKHIL